MVLVIQSFPEFLHPLSRALLHHFWRSFFVPFEWHYITWIKFLGVEELKDACHQVSCLLPGRAHLHLVMSVPGLNYL